MRRSIGHLLIPYLVSVVLLATGMVVVVNTVSGYDDKVEELSVAQEKIRVRQETIEQEQRKGHNWQVRAVQLARFIERQGLSVPKPTVPLRDVPLETPPTGPVASPDAPTSIDPSLEPTPFEPPPLPTLEPPPLPIPTPSLPLPTLP